MPLSINTDVFESMPDYMQKILKDVGAEYAVKLAKAQADKADDAIKAMEAGGAKVVYLSDAERQRWAAKLPTWPWTGPRPWRPRGCPANRS